MKFFAALLFIGVSAASSATSPNPAGSTCLADYILEDCLKSTTTNANNCKPTDYVCLCAAYQAVYTCYNNCPNDIRAPSVQQQVDSYCRTASLLATTPTTAQKTKTGSSNSEETSSSASAPSNNDDSSPTTGSGTQTGTQTTHSGSSVTTAARSSSSNAAATMIGNVAGVFMAVAGAAAAMM